MIIVNCPSCHSKFRFQNEGFAQNTIKMRCSICQHIFTYTIEPEVSLEKEFDMLLSSAPGDESPQAQGSPRAEEAVFEESSMELTETPPEDATLKPEPEESHAAPESVIREIDSILGTGPETTEEEEETVSEETGKKSPLKTAILIACILIVGASSLWLFREKIPIFGHTKQEAAQTPVQKGPFFSIDGQNLTYEMLTHEQEGNVLVIRGNLRKISTRPVESVMVEARVYDSGGTLIESRLAYAGIVPDRSEFIKQPQKDIDALLTSDPASPGSTLPTSDIPFVVAFFGKPAQAGSSFQVEVKDIRWK